MYEDEDDDSDDDDARDDDDEQEEKQDVEEQEEETREEKSSEENEEESVREEKDTESEKIEAVKKDKYWTTSREQSLVSIVTGRTCRLPQVSTFSVKYPTFTSFTLKNLKNAVDFHSEEKQPCKNTWYRDVKSTHIRNRPLLDLPYKFPKCCSDLYNINNDRKKQRKLNKFGIQRKVRTIVCEMEMEEVKRCIPELETGETKITYFPECYILPESSSDEDEDEGSYDVCMRDSISECSGCSTLGGGTRRRMHKVIKKSWRELLHKSEIEQCREAIEEEINKHKMGYNVKLKLDKFL